MKKIRVGVQLMLICMSLVILPAAVIGFVSNTIIRRNALIQQEEDLSQRVAFAFGNINNVFKSAQEQVNTSLSFGRYTLDGLGQPYLDTEERMKLTAINQITKAEKNITIPVMKIGTNQIAYNYDLVDKMKAYVGGTATVFQVIEGGLLRINTNVMTLDGMRAVHTYIPEDSPVYKTVMRGDTYYGRAFVVNAWYITAYEPLFDSDWNVIGALYAGVLEKTYQERLLENFAGIEIGESGYIFVLNGEGDYVLSKGRTRDGENLWESADADGIFFIQDIVNTALSSSEGETNVQYYSWQNEGESRPRGKLASFTYFGPWDWIVAASAYRDDVLNSAAETLRAVIIVSIGSVICGFFISFFLSRSYSRPLGKLERAVQEVAEGDLTRKVEIKSNVREVWSLKENLMEKLLGSFSEILRQVKHNAMKSGRISDSLNFNVKDTLESSKQINSSAVNIKTEIDKLTDSINDSSSAVEQIVANISGLSNLIENQSANVTETSAAIEEMSASINNVAAIASSRQEAADQLLKVTENGGDHLSETNTIVENVASRIDGILGMVDIINDITDKTNILGMNAAIEAAHAGESGKGFAVVADEIRSLAETTSVNAKNITEEIRITVHDIQKSLESSKSSRDAFVKISSDVKTFVDAFEEITSSMLEISAGSKQVVTAVSELRNISEEINGSSNEMNTGASEVASAISSLRDVAGRTIDEYQSILGGLEIVKNSQTEVSLLSDYNGKNIDALNESVDIFKIKVAQESVDFSKFLNQHHALIQSVTDSHGEAENEQGFNIGDATRCEFGQWFGGGHVNSHEHEESVQTIDKVHREFHKTAESALALKKAGNHEDYNAELLKLKNLSREFVFNLLEVEKLLGSS